MTQRDPSFFTLAEAYLRALSIVADADIRGARWSPREIRERVKAMEGPQPLWFEWGADDYRMRLTLVPIPQVHKGEPMWSLHVQIDAQRIGSLTPSQAVIAANLLTQLASLACLLNVTEADGVRFHTLPEPNDKRTRDNRE